MDQYSGPGTPNDYEMSNWPRTPFEHHGHPHYFGLPAQPEMGPGLEASVPWQEINYSETASVVTPTIKRERRSRSGTPPKRNTNGVQRRRGMNSRKLKRVQKQEDVTEFPQRIEGPPLLREDCPVKERFLIETRHELESHKGTDLWDLLPQLFAAKFHEFANKAALQMKIRRARTTFMVWSQEDVSLVFTSILSNVAAKSNLWLLPPSGLPSLIHFTRKDTNCDYGYRKKDFAMLGGKCLKKFSSSKFWRSGSSLEGPGIWA